MVTRGAVIINNTSYNYNGLWERQQAGTGLVKCTGAQPSTPQGFILSHCVYLSLLFDVAFQGGCLRISRTRGQN